MESNIDFHLPLSYDIKYEELNTRVINNYSIPIIVKEEHPMFILEVKSVPFTKKQWKKLPQEIKLFFIKIKKIYG